ncbi:MAG: hypothetical protein ACKO5A_08105 [Actinomycetota bacterium]|jgi:hypothetical protein|nr:hypothetical protein [Actinomycetota bacterium]
MRHHRRNQCGAVGGLEAIVFVALLLIGGSVVATAAWTTLRGQASLDAAAREYLRSYSEAPDPLTAAYRGDRAARRSLRDLGIDEHRVRILRPDLLSFGPCGLAEVRLELDLPPVPVPFGDAWPSRTISVNRLELIDPHREMIPGREHNPERTPCAT